MSVAIYFSLPWLFISVHPGLAGFPILQDSTWLPGFVLAIGHLQISTITSFPSIFAHFSFDHWGLIWLLSKHKTVGIIHSIYSILFSVTQNLLNILPNLLNYCLLSHCNIYEVKHINVFCYQLESNPILIK